MYVWLIVIMIIVGALAYRSATFIFSQVRGGHSARLALSFSQSPARQFLMFYVIAGLPLAFLNGYLLRLSWVDRVTVGIGTWVGMLASIAIARRFDPTLQFFLFGSVNLIWLVFNLTALTWGDRG
jgi:hypothetical protein